MIKFLILLTIFFSCSRIDPMSDNLNRVGYLTAKKIEDQCPLKCESIGRIAKDCKIDEYTVTFHYPTPLTIEISRCLIIKSAQIALETFQNDIVIQEHLYETPFGINSLAIFIFTETFTTEETPIGYLSMVALSNGKVLYERFDLKRNKFESILEESYEEALQKCQGSLPF
jgi:hypothetical protein